VNERPWREEAEQLFFRLAASGLVPAKYFVGDRLDRMALSGRRGRLDLEIVTHCWRYEHLLAYQLSSLFHHPPRAASVRMVVFFSPEDEGTNELLAFFGSIDVEGVVWDWRPLPKDQLFRRAIGRNLAARATTADWIWFTDCDVIFGEGCLDGLAERLQGRTDRLVFPREEHVTPLLPPDDPMLARAGREGDPRVSADPERFNPQPLSVAKGAMQITHGDVARAVGYCEAIPLYQRPASRWQKAWEDRAFRWLLGTDGEPIDVPGVFRIRHAAKGRYGNRMMAALRGGIRRATSRSREALASRRRSRR
jgi:hypothetical protein